MVICETRSVIEPWTSPQMGTGVADIAKRNPASADLWYRRLENYPLEVERVPFECGAYPPAREPAGASRQELAAGSDRKAASRWCPPAGSPAGSAARWGSRRTGGGRRDRSGWSSNRATSGRPLTLGRLFRPWHAPPLCWSSGGDRSSQAPRPSAAAPGTDNQARPLRRRPRGHGQRQRDEAAGRGRLGARSNRRAPVGSQVEGSAPSIRG
jgi:hypothetical protein